MAAEGLLTVRAEEQTGKPDKKVYAITQAGKNALLVKLGQNEQVEDWTIEWEFQLRVTDALGTPIRPLRVGVPLPSTARVN